MRFAVGGDLFDDHREQRRGGHRENRAGDAHQRPADEQRDHHRDRAHAHAALHDLRDEDVRLELEQDQEIDPDHERQFWRYGDRDRHCREPADDRPQHGNRFADRGDERDDIEVGHVHQPETDRGESAHHSGQDELRAQPRADFRNALPRREGDVASPSERHEPDEILEHRAGLEQQIEGENHDRDQAEDPADHAGDRDEHRADRVAARAGRRVLNRLLERNLVDHQAVADQELLQAVELARQLLPEGGCLGDERRNDQEAEEDESGNDDEVDRQNRQPARHPTGAGLRRSLDEFHERRHAHRDQRADVDDHQRIACRPEQCDQKPGAHDRGHGLEHPAREVLVRGHEISDF
jgi:hypothetical protein